MQRFEAKKPRTVYHNCSWLGKTSPHPMLCEVAGLHHRRLPAGMVLLTAHHPVQQSPLTQRQHVPSCLQAHGCMRRFQECICLQRTLYAEAAKVSQSLLAPMLAQQHATLYVHSSSSSLACRKQGMPPSPGGSGETVLLLRREPAVPNTLAGAAAAAAADGSLAGPGKDGVDGEALTSAKGLADPEPAAHNGTHGCGPRLAGTT